WVAAAGPAANFIMAVIWAIVAKLGLMLIQADISLGQPMMFMGVAGVLINTMLMMLNLLPIPPLDGSRVLSSWLPGPVAYKFSRIEPYGFFILLGLLYFGILSLILWPLVSAMLNLLVMVFGLPAQIFSIL
ncbi:site-2 protease family protein, partial [Methylophaga sp. UBA3996]